MDNWRLAGIAWPRVCQRILCCWWAPEGGDWGGGLWFLPWLQAVRREHQCHYHGILWLKIHAGERLLAERWEICLVLAQTQIRMMLPAVKPLELLSGLLVEGREGYEKGKHCCLLPWIIQVTRVVLFVLAWISTCLFRKKSIQMLFKNPVMKSHPVCFSSGFGNKFIIYTGKHVPHVSSQDLPVFSVKVFLC